MFLSRTEQIAGLKKTGLGENELFYVGNSNFTHPPQKAAGGCCLLPLMMMMMMIMLCYINVRSKAGS